MDASRQDWEFQQRQQTPEQREAFENNWRRIQDREHRPVADVIYRQVFGDVEITRFDEMPHRSEVQVLDRLGIDFYIKLSNGQILSGQEKYLSFDCLKWRTVTISQYSWSHCAAQVYFCGYLTADGKAFSPWVILDWPMTALATTQGKILWQLQPSHTGYNPFYYTSISTLPAHCIIASAD